MIKSENQIDLIQSLNIANLNIGDIFWPFWTYFVSFLFFNNDDPDEMLPVDIGIH